MKKPKKKIRFPAPHHLAWLTLHSDRTIDWLAERMRDGFDIHHGDGDHSNNAPENLFLVEAVDHMRLHGAGLNRMVSIKRDRQREVSLKLGERAYNERLTGRRWSDITREMFPDALGLYAVTYAKRYATVAEKPWPILLEGD